MSKATPTHTTSRRSTLRGLGLAAIAGIAAPAIASANIDPDAELIRLCDRLVQFRTYELATIKLNGDEYYDDTLLQNDLEWHAIADRVREIDRPLTQAGANAMARCVVRHSSPDDDGGFYGVDLTDWMAIRVSEFLAGTVAMTPPEEPLSVVSQTAPAGELASSSRIGNWKPCCFKPGPCPGPDPCSWAEAHTPPGRGAAA